MNCGLKEEKYDIRILVKASQTGHRDSFDKIVQLYQIRAMRLAVRILGNNQDASEAVQDGFVKAYMNIAALKETDRFESWFFRIIANTAISMRKRQRSRLKINEVPGYNIQREVYSPIENQINMELTEAIQEAMQKLSKKQAKVIALFGFEDLSQQQVAEIMNCSVESVRWHVHKARQKLKVLLKEHL